MLPPLRLGLYTLFIISFSSSNFHIYSFSTLIIKTITTIDMCFFYLRASLNLRDFLLLNFENLATIVNIKFILFKDFISLRSFEFVFII